MSRKRLALAGLLIFAVGIAIGIMLNNSRPRPIVTEHLVQASGLPQTTVVNGTSQADTSHAPPPPASQPRVTAGNPPTVAGHTVVPGNAQNSANAPQPTTGNPQQSKPPTAPFAAAPPGRQGTAEAGQRRGFGANPAMQGKMALTRLFRNIGRLDEDGKAPLTPAQAKAVLAIMTPLRSQTTLTSAQAADISKQLDAQLTSAQRDTIKAMPQGGGRGSGPNGGQRPEGMRPPEGGPNARPRPEGAPQPGGEGERGRGGWQGGPPAGQRPGGEGRPAMSPEAMEKMNPFHAADDNPMAQRMAERQQKIFDALAAKAHGQ